MKGARGVVTKGSSVLALVLALVALGAGLGGCASSPPMRFYTLSAEESASAAANTSPSIRVARVTLPGEIDRPELVQRIDANRLRLAEQDRWAAPLGEMIRRTLSADLQARAPDSSIAPTPSRPAIEGFSLLHVDIEEFIANPNCSVSLRATWTLTPSGSAQPSTHGDESIQIAPPQSCQISSLPQSMSRALAELSNRIQSARPK
jgi:uncharacterized protein